MENNFVKLHNEDLGNVEKDRFSKTESISITDTQATCYMHILSDGSSLTIFCRMPGHRQYLLFIKLLHAQFKHSKCVNYFSLFATDRSA